LKRREILARDVLHIGKEANNIDEQAIGVKKPQEFWDDEDWKKYIFDISYSEAEKMGIHRNTLKYWRKKGCNLIKIKFHPEIARYYKILLFSIHQLLLWG